MLGNKDKREELEILRQNPSRGWPVLRLRWHQSWIVGASLLVALILICGYGTSLFFSVQGINALAKIAYDQDVENALSKSLVTMRELHHLRKEMILEKISGQLKKSRPGSQIDKQTLTALLKKAAVDDLVPVVDLQIKPLDNNAVNTTAAIEWLDQETLRVLNQTILFPKSDLFESFKASEKLLHRYQLIGATLEKEIRPTLVRVNSIVLAITFTLMIGALLILANRFRYTIERVLNGFSYWSEKNSRFRFSSRWRGELKLITSQFNAMADEVEANRKKNLHLEKIASWQTIARKLAHEIKNPLTPIQMMVSQLKRRYKGEDAEFGKLLDNAQEIISEEVDSLRRMVDNFSEFARLPYPKPKPTSLISLLEKVVELEKAAFEHHDIKFETLLTEAVAEIDDGLIRQVIINLIKNAAEACGSTPSRIRVYLQKDATRFKIVVEDNGPGIPGDMQSDIFEAYFTTKHTGPAPGMGLGLTVCQKIILDHQGELLVKSVPGETQFIIKLPKKLKDFPHAV